MWDSLQVIHEGTNEVNQVRITTLNQECELFHMKHGENFVDMQKRPTHLINRLNALSKHISNEIATNKFLRCFNREWQPKVTAIEEANDLLTLDITTLFGKLEEHEQELICLEKYEKKIKKEKNKEKRLKRNQLLLWLLVLSPQQKSMVKVNLVIRKSQMMKKRGCLLNGTINTLREME